jgi:hypothetical protein
LGAHDDIAVSPNRESACDIGDADLVLCAPAQYHTEDQAVAAGIELHDEDVCLASRMWLA